MNNTPIINKMTIELRILLDDIVSGSDDGVKAETNGKDFTASKINQYLLESMKELVKRLVNTYDIDMTADLAPGLIKTQTITLSLSGTDVNKDFMYATGLLVNSDSFKLESRIKFQQDSEPIIIRGYAIDAGKLYAYVREDVGTPAVYTLNLQESGTATLYYLKADRVNTSTGKDLDINSGTDTTLDMRWRNWVLRYAAQRACEDKGSEEWLVKSQIFKKSADEVLK
jgi:hypothetical protein